MKHVTCDVLPHKTVGESEVLTNKRWRHFEINTLMQSAFGTHNWQNMIKQDFLNSIMLWEGKEIFRDILGVFFFLFCDHGNDLTKRAVQYLDLDLHKQKIVLHAYWQAEKVNGALYHSVVKSIIHLGRGASPIRT